MWKPIKKEVNSHIEFYRRNTNFSSLWGSVKISNQKDIREY